MRGHAEGTLPYGLSCVVFGGRAMENQTWRHQVKPNLLVCIWHPFVGSWCGIQQGKPRVLWALVLSLHTGVAL